MKLQIQGQTLHLLEERALYWEEQKILALSDVHLGKAEIYQRDGIPIPTDFGTSDLQRLARVIQSTDADEILILGDFIHGPKAWTRALKDELFGFLHVHGRRKFHLILGNHERASLPHLLELGITIEPSEITREPFSFTHGHLKRTVFGFQIEGHLHPQVSLKDGPLRARLPCFLLKKDRLLLPSFGEWTGGFVIDKSTAQRIFPVSPDGVFELNL